MLRGFAQKVVLEPCRDAEERNSQQLDDFLGKAMLRLDAVQVTLGFSLHYLHWMLRRQRDYISATLLLFFLQIPVDCF